MWAELKRKEVEYEKRRNKKVQYYESVKHAQTVQVDEIPLPQIATNTDAATPQQHNVQFNIPGRIPLPASITEAVQQHQLMPSTTAPPLFGGPSMKKPPLPQVFIDQVMRNFLSKYFRRRLNK